MPEVNPSFVLTEGSEEALRILGSLDQFKGSTAATWRQVCEDMLKINTSTFYRKMGELISVGHVAKNNNAPNGQGARYLVSKSGRKYLEDFEFEKLQSQLRSDQKMQTEIDGVKPRKQRKGSRRTLNCDHIHEAMKVLGWDRHDMAHALGFSDGGLGNWFSGECKAAAWSVPAVRGILYDHGKLTEVSQPNIPIGVYLLRIDDEDGIKAVEAVAKAFGGKIFNLSESD